MILIADFEDFLDVAMAELLEEDGYTQMFNYRQTVMDDSELSNFMKDEFTESKNTGIFFVVPGYGGTGSQDNFRLVTGIMLFFVDKTDYSEHDHAGYMAIIKRVQVKVNSFLEFMLYERSSGSYCQLLSFLDEKSVTVNPVWKRDGCNGWVVQIDL